MAAGLAWGIIFSVPPLLPDYPALALSAGRYLAFGLIALIPAWLDDAVFEPRWAEISFR